MIYSILYISSQIVIFFYTSIFFYENFECLYHRDLLKKKEIHYHYLPYHYLGNLKAKGILNYDYATKLPDTYHT